MKLSLNNDTFNIPDSWDELNHAQFLRISDLSSRNLPVNQYKTYILLAILGFHAGSRMHAYTHNPNSPAAEGKIKEPCYQLHDYKNKKKYLISVCDMAYVVNSTLNYLFIESIVDNKPVIQIDCKLKKTIITSISVQGETWYGPGDSLSNSIYEEYIRCLVSASEFASGDSTGLDRLICAMYRPGNSENASENGDFREPFNDNLVQHRAKFVANLHPSLKNAIMLQFNGAIRNISSLHDQTRWRLDRQRLVRGWSVWKLWPNQLRRDKIRRNRYDQDSVSRTRQVRHSCQRCCPWLHPY